MNKFRYAYKLPIASHLNEFGHCREVYVLFDNTYNGIAGPSAADF